MNSKWPRVVLVALLLRFGFSGFPACMHAAENAPRIDVIQWFDTEAYLLPASDDAVKHVAEMLTERNIQAAFKVGEKARTLERRGQDDLIAALRKHDIGFQADFHSVHPTPSGHLVERMNSNGRLNRLFVGDPNV